MDNKEYEIQVKGSLGILAYGDIALRAWRKVKKANKKVQGSRKNGKKA